MEICIIGISTLLFRYLKVIFSGIFPLLALIAHQENSGNGNCDVTQHSSVFVAALNINYISISDFLNCNF